MDIVVKMARIQIINNVLYVKYTQTASEKINLCPRFLKDIRYTSSISFDLEPALLYIINSSLSIGIRRKVLPEGGSAILLSN